MTDWTDEDALRLDIAMALAKIKTKPRGDREDIYRKMVAEQIVKHLKLSTGGSRKDRQRHTTASARQEDSAGRCVLDALTHAPVFTRRSAMSPRGVRSRRA